jgi:hypothetical protein
MATKNAVTQKNAIAIVRNYVEQYPEEFEELVHSFNEDATVDDLLDTLGNMFQKLNRTNTSRTTNNKKRLENERLVEAILPAMAEPRTAGDIAAAFDEITSVPKATAVLKVGVDMGVFVRLEKRKKSESYRYVMADMADQYQDDEQSDED